MIQFKYTPEAWDTPLGSLSDPSPMQEMTMTLTTEGMTWDEATREFHNFLRAAGFVIPYDIEWYEDGKDVDDDRDPLQKLTDWEEKYRPEECEVVKGVEHMTFDEWWSSYIKPASIYTLKETTEDAWEAGIQEGLGRNCEWVGLTQEELQDLCVKSYHTDNAGETHFNRGYFADAIEAKLKEKNT